MSKLNIYAKVQPRTYRARIVHVSQGKADYPLRGKLSYPERIK